MKYTRFLRKEDYIGLISTQHLEQVSAGYNEKKFNRVEEDAEITVLEHMSVNYQIETAFAIGKNILDYDTKITYPKGVYFWKDGEVVRTLKIINGSNSVEENPHWEVAGTIPTEDELEIAVQYSQMIDFYAGSVALYDGVYYRCLIDNGYSFNNIRIPGRVAVDADADVVSKGTNIVVDDPRNKNLKRHMARLSLYELCKSISANNVPQTILIDYEASMKWLNDCNKLKIDPMIDRRVSESGKVSTDWAIAEFDGSSTAGNAWMI